MTFYLDGVNLTPFNNSVGISESYLFFGSDPLGSQEYLYGALDDIRVYNRALTKDEIISFMKE